MRALSACPVHGCPELTQGGKCPAHQTEAARRAEQRRPSAHQRGYDKRWQRTRWAYLDANPHCVTCGARATDVDHIDGHGPLGPRGHDWTNLQALCHACHLTKTARYDGGGWPRRG